MEDEMEAPAAEESPEEDVSETSEAPAAEEAMPLPAEGSETAEGDLSATEAEPTEAEVGGDSEGSEPEPEAAE